MQRSSNLLLSASKASSVRLGNLKKERIIFSPLYAQIFRNYFENISPNYTSDEQKGTIWGNLVKVISHGISCIEENVM